MRYEAAISLASLCILASLADALSGKSVGDNIIAFLGIPYAQPPIGQLRLRDPIEVSLEDGWYDDPKQGCLEFPYDDGSEDCLYLNVFRRDDTQINDPKKKRVLLFFTNSKLSEEKAASVATEEVDFVYAALRTGFFGNFGNAFHGVEDVVHAVRFLRGHAHQLGIGRDVTIWAEASAAEAVAAALSRLNEDEVSSAILVHGNQMTRTLGRPQYAQLASEMFLSNIQCEILTRDSAAAECLQGKPIVDVISNASLVHRNFFPFGDPFRVPTIASKAKNVPVIIGVFKSVGQGYAKVADFSPKYSLHDFRRFLASVVPNSLHKNGALLRKILHHHYVTSRGSENNTYFLFETVNKVGKKETAMGSTGSFQILLDRDFLAPTYQLTQKLIKEKTTVFLFEYGIENLSKNCLEAGDFGSSQIFCDRMLKYFTRFTSKGDPSEGGCDPKNPSWPAMGSSKREYFVVLPESGVLDWQFDFHLAAVDLWNRLLPSLEAEIVEEVEEIEPLVSLRLNRRAKTDL